jgi:NAD+ kinase
VNALVLVKPNSGEAAELAAKLKIFLNGKNIGVETYTWAKDSKWDSEPVCKDCGIVVSLGGDGTVLFAARTASPRGIPILPVNMGALGFIASITPDEITEAFCAWEAGASSESKRLMLEARVERNGRVVFNGSCLNDAVISAGGIAKTIGLDAAVMLEDENINLASYRCDGLILSTATGSTAYNASAGGPILDPETEDVILNPICPFTLLHRPLVIPADGTLKIAVPFNQRAAVILTMDGQVTYPLECGDYVLVRKAAFKARLLAANRKMFYGALHTKLKWPLTS